MNEKSKVCSILFDRDRFFEMAIQNEIKNQQEQIVKFGLSRKFLSWEKLFKTDMEEGKGFMLDTGVNYNRLDDENYMIETASIMSYKFGIRSNDTKPVQAKRFRCVCGFYEGEYAGVKCPKCGTETQNRYAIRGWWSLNKFKVFNPDWLSVFMAHLNSKVINVAQLKENLSQVSSRKDRTGFNIMDLQNRENLVAFIEMYASENTKDYFISNIDCAMTDKIPCISKDYRYYSVVQRIGAKPTVNNHPLNRLYIIINNSVRDLNRMTGRESSATICRHLNRINDNLMEIYKQNKHTLGGTKESYIRGKVAGRRKRSSGRMVLEAMLHPRADVCTIPYNFFGELTIDYYKEEYIKYGMTPESENRMRNNYPSTEDKLIMIKVLRELKERSQNTCFVYRAPCLYSGSILSLEIIGLTNSDVFRMGDIPIDANLHGDAIEFNFVSVHWRNPVNPL